MELQISTADYASGGVEFDLYIASPSEQEGTLPAVIVAHAWDGLNAPIEATTRRVAELGYVAIAPDVYGKGVRGDLAGDNSELMNPLMEDRAMLDARLAAAYAAVQGMEQVDRSRIAAVGYCFGGLCVLDLARMVPDGLRSVISVHGVLADAGPALASAGPITAQVLIEHGWDDPLATPENYLAFAAEMSERRADWQAHVHGGVMHAFTVEGASAPENGVQYDAGADRRSWKSIVDMLEESL